MCNCIDKIDEEIKDIHPNLIDPQLSFNIVFDSKGKPKYYPRIEILYKKTEKSKNYKSFPIVPIYCPFCGKKYD
jgi:hypothetical protein